jgi:hypothetical protein
VDDATDYTWSYFLQRKSDTTEKLLHFIHGMKERGTPVRCIWCDNAGENRSLQVAAHNTGIRIVYEYTYPGTPQQMGRAERKFAVLYEYIRSILNNASLPPNLRTKQWGEAANHSTDIINSICTPYKTSPLIKIFYVHNHPFF